MENPSFSARRRRPAAAGTLCLTALLVLVLFSGLAGAAPMLASATPQNVWAYGAVETLSFQGTSHGWQYSGTGTYGYSVILNQTNTSATTFELSANRTMGTFLQVHYCYPSCRSPVYFGNESYHAYETVAATAHLSTVGNVNENGTRVSAVALNSSDSHLLANVTETSSSYLPIDHSVGPRSHYLSANVVATSSVAFSPGLGLLPIDLGSAQSWNSSSEYLSHAAANYEYYGASSGPHGSGQLGPVTGNFSLPASGTVSLSGSYSPSNTVLLAGASYPEVSLRLVGPFAVREGFILLPSATDLFDGGAQPWVAQQNGSTTATMSFLDARAVGGGHLGIAASEWVYDSGTANPSSTVSAAPSGSGLAPSMSGVTDPAPATTVQGQPEAVDSAQSQQSCLLTGSGCPAGSSTSGGGLRGLVGLAAVGALVVVVVALVILVAERRRMPPPVYPNAALYPPGNARPGTRAPPMEPPAPAEDDPLRNLW